jgi:predicted ATP-grasp superfamily ATP-dependent carboligase
MPELPAVLIVAVSGRALAASARRAGYCPLVADLFGDQDTIAVAGAHVPIQSTNGYGLAEADVLAALDKLARGREPCGIVCGTGFEDQPELLARIGQRWTLIGNGPEIVAKLKDPVAMAELCRSCGIPHPITSRYAPEQMHGWLAKRIGGAGGSHIRCGRVASAGFYYQRRVEGCPISACVVANGSSAAILGFSSQWASPTRQRRFRFGGAARPATLAPEMTERLTAAIERLMPHIGLVGLNGVDFLVDGVEFHLLEINPRPSAVLDIFEQETGDSLFGMHVAACHGALPQALPSWPTATASEIVYADEDIPPIPPLVWPAWTADRPIAGSTISAQSPVCTVLASADTAAEAKRLVSARAKDILARVRARST